MNVQEPLLEKCNEVQDSEFDKIDTQHETHTNNENLLLSIVIPMFNEENSIKSVLNRIPNYYKNEIIIVDDGSFDDSVKKINEVKHQNIKLIHHHTNKGYGAALLTGIQHAKGDLIITLDSDGQHNPKELPKLIKPIINNEADIVVGSRYLGNSEYKIPLHTRVGELIVKNCLWFLFKQIVYNNQSGYRAFSKKSLDIFDEMIYKGFGFCTEILFKASYNNYRIKEVPVTIYKREHGSSYVQLLRIIKAISSCIAVYTMKKFNIKRVLPKLISHRIYPKTLNYLKKIFN